MQLRRVSLAQIHTNVMELLVAHEVERRLQPLLPKLTENLNRTEIATYALNHLPPLYASSQEGLHHQQLRGRQELGKPISKAVSQAIAAIQRDPIRLSTPLRHEEEIESRAALEGLQDLLQQETLSWSDLVNAVEQALTKAAQGEITWKQKTDSPDQKAGWSRDRYNRW